MATPDTQNLFERFLQIYGGQTGSTEPTRSEPPRYQSPQPAYSAPGDAYGSEDGYGPGGGVLRGWSSPSPAAPLWARALAGPGGRIGRGLPFFPMPFGPNDIVKIPDPHLERSIPQSTRDFWNAVSLGQQMFRGQWSGDGPSNGDIEGSGASQSKIPPGRQPNRSGGQEPWIVGPEILKEEQERQARPRYRQPQKEPAVDPHFRELTRVPPIGLGSEGDNEASRDTARFSANGGGTPSGIDDDDRRSLEISSPSLAPDREQSSWRDDVEELLRKIEAANGGSNGRGAPPSRRDDYCSDRQGAENGKCWSAWRERRDSGLVGYPWDDILEGCKERARQRFMACFQNGGRPPKREPSEWGPEDEEAWFNDQR